MIRKFLLPAAAALVLAGCVTPGYNYRGGSGDYYYGQSVHSVPYGSVGYGTRGGFYGSFGYGSVYGSPYGYGYPYGGYGAYGGYYPGIYYPGYYRSVPRHVYYPYPVQRPGVGQPRPRDGEQRRAPWRDMEGWTGDPRRGQGGQRRGPRGQEMGVPQPQRAAMPQQVVMPQPQRMEAPRAAPQPRGGGALRSVYSERRATTPHVREVEP